MAGPDIIDLEILDDGTISVKTSSISQQNHISADELLDEITSAAGGSRKTEQRKHPYFDNRDVIKGGKIVERT